MAMSETTFKSYLSKILSARYGEEVRGSIHDSLQGMYDIVKQNVIDVSDANKRINDTITNANNKLNDAVSKANTAISNANKATNRANDAASIIETLNIGDINAGEIATKRYVDGIQIGGTNILRGTNVPNIKKSRWLASTWGTAVGDGSCIRAVSISVSNPPSPNIIGGVRLTNPNGINTWNGINQGEIPMAVGQTYTLSCYARLTKGSGNCQCQIDIVLNGESKHLKNETALSTKWTKCAFTYTVPDTATNDYFGASLFLSKTSGETTAEICGMKLEIGNKATDWSPSPEDVEIGGTNLLRDSNAGLQVVHGNALYKWGSAGDATTSTRTVIEITDCPNNSVYHGYHVKYLAGNSASVSQIIKAVADKEYTVSCYVRGEEPFTFMFQLGDSTYIIFEQKIESINEWTHVHYTFIPKQENFSSYAGTNSNFTIRFGLRAASSEIGTSFDICGMKVENGNVATDWSPSPDDMQPAIFDSANKVQLSAEQLKALATALKTHLQ